MAVNKSFEIVEQKLEFTALRHDLYALCDNEVSQFLTEQMGFMQAGKALHSRLEQLGEMIQFTASGVDIPSFRFGPLRDALRSLRPEGSYLKVESLRPLRELLNAVVETKRSLAENEDYPNLSELATGLDDLVDLRRRLHNLIDDAGEIKDTASKELRAIRSELRQLQGSIGQTMQSILREAKAAGWVEKDATPAMRDGRLLLPIIPSAKREIGGIVHEESSTGRTLYMEPERMVAMNNRIREKQSEEQREIVRLLREFSNFVRRDMPVLQRNCQGIGILDFNRAKARLANGMEAVIPQLSTEGEMEWQVARHPLLERHLKSLNRELVPLTLKLNKEQRLLIISGPNAGGKSIALKTVGLLQYMLQCGLAVPMMDHSTCTLFDQIFLDIGDAQSLENDLSTYSSHLQGMKRVLREATSESLILIDEFGSGTEPTIGGAIAEALLDHFRQMGCYGVITTHYGNLKDYSELHEGVVNGAMLFDRGRIEPLYQLFIGQPGSSFALEVARKIGLPGEIIDYASELVGSDYLHQDKYLQDIIRDKAYWKRKREEVKRQERKLQEKQSKLDERLDNFSKKRRSLLAKAEQEALEIVNSANATVERTIREIKEAKAEKEPTQKARAKLERKKSHLNRQAEKKRAPAPTKREPIKEGSRVTFGNGNEVGEVVAIEGKKARVRLGNLTMTVDTSKLQPTERATSDLVARKPQVIEQQSSQRRLNFKPQLDCRGMRVDEALSAVVQFVDDANHFGYNPIRILHGTGTGALKQAIREYLRQDSRIAHFEDELVDLGGAGITVITLRDN